MAGNSKDSKILAYKDMINQLNKTISAQTELIQSLQKTLEADRLEKKENLRQQIEYLTKKLFGTSSEKRKNIDGQLNLFDEAEQEADLTWKQEPPDDITVPEHKRKSRRTHTDLFKNVPSCDEIVLSRRRAKLSNLRNTDGMYWERISSAMNSGLPLPKGK